MGLLSGTFTYRKFIVDEELPGDFKEKLVKTLPRHVFREINPKVNPEFSIGWVNAFDPTDHSLNLEKVLFGKYIILGLRKDRKSVPGAILKAEITAAIRAQMRERKGRKLSREEIASLKEMVKEKLLENISPTTALFEAVWNYETREVYFSSTATKPITEFIDLFQETFELTLLEQTLVSRAEDHIESNGLDLLLADLETSQFGR